MLHNSQVHKNNTPFPYIFDFQTDFKHFSINNLYFYKIIEFNNFNNLVMLKTSKIIIALSFLYQCFR
jgi:hypothetical protein